MTDDNPDFIYSGPFLKKIDPDPFINTLTPLNLQLQGIFTRSLAHILVRDRLPVIITKVIDYLSREESSISKSNPGCNTKKAIELCSQLKNEVVTNKMIVALDEDCDESYLWNKWIMQMDKPYYFTAPWVFTECYVYRRLREISEICKMPNFDPFVQQKRNAATQNMHAMCVVADRVCAMVDSGDEDKKIVKENLTLLLKLMLWSNKCDLSQTNGEQSEPVSDPIKMIDGLKDKLLVDDTGKICDFMIDKSKTLTKQLNDKPVAAVKCSCTRMAVSLGMQEQPDEVKKPALKEGESPPPPPEIKQSCPAKQTAVDAVYIDIICDNAGYELFTDICFAYYLIKRGIAQKIRFHLKNMPWFVSDAMVSDFEYMLSTCSGASFSKEIPVEVPEKAVESSDPPPPPIVINSAKLQRLGGEWKTLLDEGKFILSSDRYWTYPHVYKDMKQIDEAMYRKLQLTMFAVYKGDLNYRKLVGDINWYPMKPFQEALQGYFPSPLCAIRTVKSDLITGLGKGKAEQLNKIDEQWMAKGEYGVIQFSPKAEALVPMGKPCPDFGTDKCAGEASCK